MVNSIDREREREKRETEIETDRQTDRQSIYIERENKLMCTCAWCLVFVLYVLCLSEIPDLDRLVKTGKVSQMHFSGLILGKISAVEAIYRGWDPGIDQWSILVD